LRRGARETDEELSLGRWQQLAAQPAPAPRTIVETRYLRVLQGHGDGPCTRCAPGAAGQTACVYWAFLRCIVHRFSGALRSTIELVERKRRAIQAAPPRTRETRQPRAHQARPVIAVRAGREDVPVLVNHEHHRPAHGRDRALVEAMSVANRAKDHGTKPRVALSDSKRSSHPTTLAGWRREPRRSGRRAGLHSPRPRRQRRGRGRLALLR
jgi:hypothetical protein